MNYHQPLYLPRTTTEVVSDIFPLMSPGILTVHLNILLSFEVRDLSDKTADPLGMSTSNETRPVKSSVMSSIGSWFAT